MKLYHGDIVYAADKSALQVHENSYIAVEDGKVVGIFPQIPEKYEGAEVTDYGRGLIIPAFSDLHVHASQYVQRGIGMDMLLSDWLNHYTFPQEARFKGLDYAEPIYDAFVKDMVRHGTFHASMFATIHREATNVLFEKMEENHLYGLVGKVNMDTGSPDILCETLEESLRETEMFLEEHSGSKKVRPILTPRFAPTCTKEVLYGLGELAHKYEVGLQTHLVESLWEASEAVRLFPDCSSDAEIYEKAGLMDCGPTIFAHFIFPTEEDIRIVKAHDAITVHCPDATTNIIAGIMPVAALREQGISIAVGSDIAGGHGIAVYKQVARAIQLSKLKEFYEPEGNRTITLAEAFYMATAEGGRAFGKIGKFEEGYQFNALVIDDMEDKNLPLSPEQRLERFCYIGDDRNIKARFIDGEELGEI